jgi:hypothetical protein
LTVSPTPGEVESIGTVEYKYDNYNVSSLNGTPSAYIYKEGETNPVQMVSISLEDGAFSITADPAITSPGIYTITIPENSFKLTDPTSESDVVYDSEKISTVYQIIGQENEELPDPQIGDFYYSDGTWSSTLVNKTDATPIGVVFYVGIASDYKDNATLYKVKDGSAALEDFHGYVVALHDATYFDESNHTCTWSAFNSNDPGCGCSTNTSDFLGYSNTLSIKAHAGTELSANSDSYPAAYYATDFFESQVPAPAQSSGWFLPSAYQLKYIYDRVYFELAGSSTATVENSLKALADYGGAELYVRDSEYWTSTEYVDSYGCSYRAYYMCFDYSNFSPGFVTWSNKNRERRVRSILAF